jgi:alpha-D-ribose 1-methylphosphonate 5-triphosphate synthase subunit PhnI
MYSSVADLGPAVAAAAALARAGRRADHAGGDEHLALANLLPALVDQVMAEAGVAEAGVAARALLQAGGDVARAVSLVRAWAATLPRLPGPVVSLAEVEPVRRVTPGFRRAEGGQYLGPSLDYESRLLDLGTGGPRHPAAPPGAAGNGHRPGTPEPPPPAAPTTYPRAVEGLEQDSLVGPPEPPARAADRTRQAGGAAGGDGGRGPFLQLLARAETGTLTALAYAGQRGFAGRVDPTLVELRAGGLPVRLAHPATGGSVTVGRVDVSLAEVVLYRAHDDETDARFTLGVGATFGRLERRAIAAAMLDANCVRAATSPRERVEAPEDQELLTIVLDGQEAAGFVEHLKLPHHVTFTSDLDRVRQARAAADREAAG